VLFRGSPTFSTAVARRLVKTAIYAPLALRSTKTARITPSTAATGCRPHLSDARRARQYPLVLVEDRQRSDDRVAALEEAKAQFQKSWDDWKAWAKLEEVP
jgi:hypothetical protein